MTTELFQLLDEKGLSAPETLAAQIEKLSLTKIVEIDQILAEKITPPKLTIASDDISNFKFWPNSELAAKDGCWHEECRTGRLVRLARFATMWADSVYIPTYFGITSPDKIEDRWREWFYGSVRALLATRPVIEAGLITIVAPKPIECPLHHPEVDPELARQAKLLVKAETAVLREYDKLVNVTVETCCGRHCTVMIDAPEELMPGGGGGYTTDLDHCGPPDWLPKTIKKRIAAGEILTYQVPKTHAARSEIIRHSVIHPAVEDVLIQHVQCQNLSAKYLTDRPVDSTFLRKVNQDANLASWTAVLSQHLQYEMPILTGVPLTELIDLRTHGYEAFQVYRDTMKEIINKHIVNKPAITGTEAKDIHDDIVLPQLHKMNQKLKAAKDKLSNRTRRDVLIAGGTLVLGLSSGLVFPPLALSAGAAIPFAIDAAKTVLERSDTSDELKSHNLYFLWQVAQKSRRN